MSQEGYLIVNDEDNEFVIVPVPEPVHVSVPAPEPVHVSVPAPEPVHDVFLHLLKSIFRGTSCENLLLVSKDNSRKFYDNVQCPETIVDDIANELLRYSHTHTTVDLSPDKPCEIMKPFFHSTYKTMTLLAVLLILYKQMEEAYEVLMIVSGTGRSDTLVTALVIHMCEQNIGLNDMWQKEITEMLSVCRTRHVPENVRDFANAILHHK